MKKLTVYLIRHGQTYYNIYGKLQGWGNSPLTEKGINDAINAGKKLSNVKFAAAYCSDTTRAHDTAKKIVELNQESNLTDNDIVVSPFFREQFYGSFEGENIHYVWEQVAMSHGMKNLRDIQEKYSLAKAKDLMKDTDPFHDSENNEEYWNRLNKGFDLIGSNNELSDGDNVLLVGHSNTILSIVEKYGHGKYDVYHKPANGSVTKLLLNDKDIIIDSYNE